MQVHEKNTRDALVQIRSPMAELQKTTIKTEGRR
jgi:hypothetical protein